MSSEWEVVRMKTTVTGIERHCILRRVIAQCDECGDQYLGGDVWNSQSNNEDLLRTDGWVVLDGNVHICPACSARRGQP